MQDSKNLIIAIVLCIGLMLGWGTFAEYMGWVKRPDPAVVAEQQKAASDAAEESRKVQQQAADEAAQARKLPIFTPSAGRDVLVETPLYAATLYSGGASLRSFVLKEYRTSIEKNAPFVNLVDEATAAVAPLGLLVNGQPSWSTGRWAFDGNDATLAAGESSTLAFQGEVDGISVRRELTFRADTYLIEEKISLRPLGDQARTVRLGYTVGTDSAGLSSGQYDSMRIAWSINNKLDEEASEKTLTSAGLLETGNIQWASAMSTYFIAAVMPQEFQNMTLKGRLERGVYRAALENPELLLTPGQDRVVQLSYWIGPKVRSMLEQAPNDLVNCIDLGMFSLIAKGLLWLLAFFQSYVHNWGISIILLTVAIKLAFWPLTAKSYASMEKMKKLQPMMTSLREKYKDDKERLNKEIMGLYKTYGVNPASGCVPILVQLPVFFGLYQALLTSIELRQASFIPYLPGTDILWLADLSAKDPLYITPLIMGATMFLQQKMSPPVGDPMQQKIMMFLPVIFTVMFLNFPSGLVLYWLVNNLLSIAQQWMMMRRSANSN